jgi:glyoxylate reductase
VTPPRIVVTRDIPGIALDLLRRVGDVWVSPDDRPLRTEELHAAVAGTDAVVTMLHDSVDGAMLAAAGDSLRVVANVAVGFDNVDVPACRARRVIVTNTPGVLVDATADLTIALLLAVTRRVAEGDRLLRAGQPWSWAMSFMLGSGLQDARLGLVGYGSIGRAVASRASAFGMRVQYTHSRSGDHPARPSGSGRPAQEVSLTGLLETSDIVSLHCPLTAATRHLIDADALRLMRPTSFLINTARGPVIDEQALVDALQSGQIRGAGLDVFEHEPHPHPALLRMDNVVMTPHLGSATSQTREAMAVLAARNVADVMSGGAGLTPV